MVAIVKRMRKLKELLNLRIGPGAAILPANVAKIQMTFSKDIWGGNRGAKHFMRDILPRLKYRNPQTPMKVETKPYEASDPAILSIIFRPLNIPAKTSTIDPKVLSHQLFKGQLRPTLPKPSESLPSFTIEPPTPSQSTANATTTSTSDVTITQNAAGFTRVQIDMKHKEDSMIWDEVMKITQARPVPPTETELEELRELEEQKKKSAVDRARVAKENAQRKREEAMMKQARSELGLA